MPERSKTPVRDYLDGITVDPVTKDDTIDPVLAQLITAAAMHLPSGGGTWRIGRKLTRPDVADALDTMVILARTWATRALAAEDELADLRRERDTVRAYFGVQS